MSFCKNGIIDFNTIDEVAPYNYMKTKIMPDGSSWARIHWLDVSSTKEFFADDTEVDYCVNKLNRFSLMGKVDFFRELGSLPEGYKKLTYIASSGTQYIDTGYYWTHENVKIFMKAMVTSNSSSQSLFGNEEARSGGRYFSIIPHGSNGTYSMYTGETGSVGSITTGVNKIFQLECWTTTSKVLTAVVDGVQQFSSTYPGTIMTYANTTSTSAEKGKIYIFTNHNSSNSTHISQRVGGMRLYEFQMWDNNILVRNFIPCKNTSGVVGLWDTVSNAFFTTPTGTFTAGTELNNLSVPQGGNYEFMLTYPKLSNGYNRWRQNISPNSNYVTSTSGTGYKAINTDFTLHAAPITRSGTSGSATYSCNVSGNWWAPIGQKVAYSTGIPAADGSTQTETELWVRLDHLHPDTIKLITSPEFYSSTAVVEPARIVEEKEIQATRIIES